MTMFVNELYCPKEGRNETVYKTAKYAAKIATHEGGDRKEIFNAIIEERNIRAKNAPMLSSDSIVNNIRASDIIEMSDDECDDIIIRCQILDDAIVNAIIEDCHNLQARIKRDDILMDQLFDIDDMILNVHHQRNGVKSKKAKSIVKRFKNGKIDNDELNSELMTCYWTDKMVNQKSKSW